MLNLSSHIELKSMNVLEKRIKVDCAEINLNPKQVNIGFKPIISSNFDEIIKNKNEEFFHVIINIDFDSYDEGSVKINGTLKQQFVFYIMNYEKIKDMQEIDIIKYTILLTYLEIRNQIYDLWKSISSNTPINLPLSSNKMFNFDNTSKPE